MNSQTLNRSNWMSGIDNDTSIAHMSIPGTHESCALKGGGPTQCQWHSITELLQRGIRFLDIRCGHAVGTLGSKEFPIYHSGVYQETNFPDVQLECTSFLDRHPSEFILMNVQHEGIPNLSGHSADSFVETFLQLVDQSHWIFPNRPPTVRECRKKIVLVRAYDSAEDAGWPASYRNGNQVTFLPGHGGLEWNGFNTDGVSSNNIFQTQNGWEKWKSSYDDKVDAIKQHLRMANGESGPGADKIWLNFLSQAGSSVGTAAQNINDRIWDFLTNTMTDTTKRLGVLAMDFSGNTDQKPTRLEDLIIRHNRFIDGYPFPH